MSMSFVRGGYQIAIVAGCLLLGGCQTAYQPGGSPGIMASVTVASANSDQIFDAVDHVFNRAGFKLVDVRPNLRVFERPGSQMDNMKYGDWDGTTVMMRAKVSMVSQGGTVTLECRVVAVRNYGQTLESENAVWGGYRKEYQSLMDQVRDYLAVH